MKKIYTTLTVLFIASLGFAQPGIKAPEKGKKEVANTVTTLPFQKKSSTPSKGGAGGAWYNYVDVRDALYNTSSAYANARVMSDTNAIVKYSTSVPGVYEYGTIQLMGVGQVFDFTNFVWSDPEVIGEGTGMPDLNRTASYNVDSVYMSGIYWRTNENTASAVVDTLIVSVVTNLERVQTLTVNSGADTICKFYAMEYAPSTNAPDVAAMAALGATVNVYKFPLTEADTAVIDPVDQTTRWLLWSFPVNITNLTDKQVAMTWTFKHDQVDAHYAGTGTGVAPRPTDSLSHMSSFSTMTFTDPDPDYHPWRNGNIFVNPELSSNLNTSLYVDVDVQYDKIASNQWNYRSYMPSFFWVEDLHHQYMAVYASCATCEFVSVKEMENKNITVRPNPATSNFTVDLLDNSTANIQLFNLVGQVVASQQVNGQATATINVSDLNSGVYMLKVMQNGKTYTSKVVVK